ncbi:hypothetical protein HYW21_09065 [Candidatus Woesearchaeota archaeon]|nr:hypothetical protein [Candidatus Woesearchaeota archaeon]
MLLKKFSAAEINEFYDDLRILVSVAYEIDQEVGNLSTNVYENLPTFKSFIEEFNKKYSHNLFVRAFLRETFSITLYFKGDALQEIVRHAVNLPGLVALGETSMKGVSPEIIERTIKHMTTTARLKYVIGQMTYVLMLQLDPLEKKVKMIYSHDILLDKKSPDFQILCWYALKDGYTHEIHLGKYKKQFSYASIDRGPPRGRDPTNTGWA